MPLLEIDDVMVRFGGVTAVNGASLQARRECVTGLIGPNGAGKTTLFNVITGFQVPQEGRVLIRGKDVTRMPVHRRARRGVGRTFQRLEGFGSLTVRDNVRAALEIHLGVRGAFRSVESRTEALLERVGIAAFADARADAIPTGPARLLELARALATDPALLLLDEPSSGLDERETEEFGSLLRELAAEGRGIVMVEHDMDLVMSVCDTIHVLDFGQVISTGTPREIKADGRVQAAYLGADTSEPDPRPAPDDAGSALPGGGFAPTRQPDDTTVLPVVTP